MSNLRDSLPDLVHPTEVPHRHRREASRRRALVAPRRLLRARLSVLRPKPAIVVIAHLDEGIHVVLGGGSSPVGQREPVQLPDCAGRLGQGGIEEG